MTSLRPEHVGQIFSYAGKAGERILRIHIGYPLEYLGYSWILRARGMVEARFMLGEYVKATRILNEQKEKSGSLSCRRSQ